mgnify:FL=1
MYKEIQVAPHELGPGISGIVKRTLRKQVEGTCQGEDGYLIVVIGFHDEAGKGRISPDNGKIMFRIKYDAILLKPYKGEVLAAQVHAVNAHGFFAHVGPFEHIFVTRYAMPADIQFSADTRRWVSQDGEIEIYKDCGVRLRITGITFKANTIEAVGTIKDHYLGLIMKPGE